MADQANLPKFDVAVAFATRPACSAFQPDVKTDAHRAILRYPRLLAINEDSSEVRSAGRVGLEHPRNAHAVKMDAV